MAKHTDNQSSEREANGGSERKSDASTNAIIALPRNTPNIEPPELELTPASRSEPHFVLLGGPAEEPKSFAAGSRPEEPDTIDVTAEPAATEEPEAPRQTSRFLLLAASVAVAAVLGSVAGSLATGGVAGLLAAKKSPAVQEAANTRALKHTVAQLGAELTALKASVEAVNRTNTSQYSRISERFDRIEKAQSEPTAKLAKITEQLDRLEKRPAVTVAATAASDTTGSIGEQRAAAAAAPPPPPAPKPVAKPPVLEGWILREVFRGRALVESRYGEFDVGPGTNLPGVGMVEDVVRQDGRWMVITPRGLIMMR